MILRNNKVALRQVHDSFAICAIYFFYTVIFNILIELALIYISITCVFSFATPRPIAVLVINEICHGVIFGKGRNKV